MFTTWFTEYFKPTVETYFSEKISFKMLLPITNAPGHPRALMETDKGNTVVFVPANSTSMLQPMDQNKSVIFKSYYLKIYFITAIESDSSDGSGQRKLKTL